jgi:outer membrane lipoprotein
MNRHQRLATVLACGLLGACVTAPKPLQGEFSALLPSEAGAANSVGERVRWGGEIVAVDTQATRSCFELLGKPLGDSARPSRADHTEGRFLACRDGFYDPALFEVGRDLTVTGVIESIEPRPIGGFEYHYPRIAAEVIYLWPERDPNRIRPSAFYFGSYGYRFAGGWNRFPPPYW